MKQVDYEIRKKIQILAVAPYEGMKALIEKEAMAYKEVEIKTVIGNLQEGVRLAQSNFHSNYDAIISRGGTADALRERVDIPVNEIPVLNTDLLRAIHLCEQMEGKKAIVGFENITSRAQTLCDILQIKIDIFTIIKENDIYPIMDQLKNDHYQIVICDVLSNSVAKSKGINTILITSSSEAINIAIKNTIRDIHTRDLLRNDNLLLRALLIEHSADTVLYREDKTLTFSSLKVSENEKLFDVLEVLIDDVKEYHTRHFNKSINGYLHSIKAIIIESSNNKFIAFFINKNKQTHIVNAAGISFYTMKELEKAYLNSFYNIASNIDQSKIKLIDIINAPLPLIIEGEYGSGKTELAKYIYLNSDNDHSFVEIDCELLNTKSKDFILNSHNSPLYYNDYIIHFKNMDKNSESFIKELLSTINISDSYKNNKIIFSYDRTQLKNYTLINYIKDKFYCLEISLRPIRENKEQIPAIANLFLSHQNIALGKDILRFDDDALTLLKEYDWPHNYIQLERILTQSVLASKDHIIHGDNIREMLQMENNEINRPTNDFEIKGTLADIENEIILKVLKENNNNQSKTAKQLGISRSTLWRIIK